MFMVQLIVQVNPFHLMNVGQHQVAANPQTTCSRVFQ